MGVEQLLEGLNEPQREAVMHAQGPLLVLAGPGSGKTRVITHRAAYLARTVTEPWHVLAVTFTNKAANEMSERIGQLDVGPGITCCTFHSFCARLLRIHADRAGLGPNFSIFDQPDQLAAVKDAIEHSQLSSENYTPSRMLEMISRAKNDMISPEEYEATASEWTAKAVAPVYRAYEQTLAGQNALDFDDLLLRTARLLGDDPELRDKLQDRYRYVLVDEYQDTNHAQYLIARGLALDHENLCVTGDPDQSIYAWRGANINNILEFERDFPTTKVVRLEQNYRSTPQILAAADEIIHHNRKRKHKKLWTQNENGPPIRVVEAEDAHEEARHVAEAIAEHVAAGGRYGDAAIFYRVNALSRVLEETLRQGRIPYQVARGVAFFHRKEIKDSLAYLRLAANPQDRVAFMRIVNVPARGIGDKTLKQIMAQADNLRVPPMEAIRAHKGLKLPARTTRQIESFVELIAGVTAVAAGGIMQKTVEHAVLNSGLRAMWHQANDDDAIKNVDELITDAAEYDEAHPDGTGSITDWLQQISLMSDVDAFDSEMGAVTLMTLHSAKGLEFNRVFIVGVEEGMLPYRRAENERCDIEEERRLCFVGMTRARQALTLSYARFRTLRGMTRRTSRSVFLTEIPRSGVDWLVLDPPGQSTHGRPYPRCDQPPGPYGDWHRGQKVRHAEYGYGQIVRIEPRSNGTHAVIQFPRYGEKTFVLERARLEVVEFNEPEYDS
jgi:DNA helicase II / ATP-dependent DNA helicase PcrA